MEKLIGVMVKVQQSEIEDANTEKKFLLDGWESVCIVYGRELGPYLGKVLPSLFELVRSAVNRSQTENGGSKAKGNKRIKDEEEDEDEDEIGEDEVGKANTTESEEAQGAIKLLGIFITQLKELYIPYI
jgi:hypothetical protein